MEEASVLNLSLILSYVPSPASPAKPIYDIDNKLGEFVYLHPVCLQIKLWTLHLSDLIVEI